MIFLGNIMFVISKITYVEQFYYFTSNLTYALPKDNGR